ncbi:MAG: hypothetical protein D6706_17220 [Chloroflexi bacterium]|nr:MAG: hypothetical protein D6706_17220 [Chloroflexota bacterium]
MIKLQVYISDECWTCEETRRILADVSPDFPDVEIELLDLNNHHRPDTVFAVPTYLINGQIAFLGNPTRSELTQKLLSVRHALHT